MGKLRIGVLGAGIVGTVSALELQSEFPTSDVTIIADKFYQDTTSDGAAGIFATGVEFSGPNEQITEQWILDSFNYYRHLMDVEPACGVSFVDGYMYTNYGNIFLENGIQKHIFPEYRAATQEELVRSHGKWKHGTYFKTLLIECPKFLPFALKKFEAQGGRIRKQTIDRLGQLQGEFDVLVNCCGLQARYLCNDKKVLPIRGQIVKVSAPWLRKFYFAEGDTYIIPHTNGSVILGGRRQFGNYDTDVSKYDTASILERCYDLLPELKKAPVLREWVGLRPYRPVIRVEAEQIGQLKIVHNYGHGGYGVTSAPGTSKHAVQLVRETLSSSFKV